MPTPCELMMLRRILSVTVSAFALGAFAIYRSSRGLDAPTRRARWTKYFVFFAIVHILILTFLAGAKISDPLLAVILVVGAIEIMRVAHDHPIATLAGYVLAAMGLLAFIRNETGAIVAFVFLVTASFDGFSQIAGQNFGRHKLAPQISPGKTIEGALGGFVGAAIVGVWLGPILQIRAHEAIALSILTSVAALGGDLLASKIKRINGVKDFSALIPGHGGILDRFDSFVAAGCGWWLALRLLG